MTWQREAVEMINENIKNARKAKGITQEEMAAELNVVRQTVSKWEKGLSVPDADVLMKIADLLGVSVNELLGTKPLHDSSEDLADKLAELNEQLAIKNQEHNLCLQADKKRGIILLLSFISMLIAMRVKNEVLSIVLTGGCLVIALLILYRNLALLTKVTTAEMKTGALRVMTVFNITIVLLTGITLILDRYALVEMSKSDDRLPAMVIISIIILFGGIISPKLPFNRHTGLRLPWTVGDEDTWNIAHRIIGYISLPLVLLYLAVSFTIRNFEAVTIVTMLLWIGIPGLISFIFWQKKCRGKCGSV